MEFIVENNIPIPEIVKSASGKSKKAVHQQMNRLTTGQSFVVPFSYSWTKKMFDEFCKKENDRKYVLRATRGSDAAK